MKDEKKTRRSFFLLDKLYHEVCIYSAVNQIDKWQVINEALKEYFEKRKDR